MIPSGSIFFNREEKSVEEKNKRKEDFFQALKFAAFSISAGVVQIASFALLHDAIRLPYWPAYLLSLLLSILYNFTLNRKFTFKAANNVYLAMLKVLGFYALFTPLSTWWGNALTAAGWNDYLVLFGTMIINLVSEFLFCKYLVYQKQQEQ